MDIWEQLNLEVDFLARNFLLTARHSPNQQEIEG
jgi:hypothetical protein